MAELLAQHPDRALLPAHSQRLLRELNLEETLLPFALELARIPPDLDFAGRRDLVLLALALLATQAQGHTRMALQPGPGHPARALLDLRPGLSFEAILADPRLRCLVGEPGSVRPLIVADGYLYSHRLFSVETGFALRVRALLEQAGPAGAATPEAIFTTPVALNLQQRAAVALALDRPLALITGGPGTGKTSIVAAILRALLARGLAPGLVALAAPTGKAAQRMGAALASLEAFPEPQTLHRLLSWHPAQGAFRHHAGNPLAAAVVIVDEASMVSQELLDRLFQALAPGARMVLLGDAQQLPSVDCGSAFGDLVATLPECAQRLTVNYRMNQADPQGRAILSAALALQDRPAELWAGPEAIARPGLEGWRGAGVELLEPGPGGVAPFLERWFREVVLGLDGFQALANRVYTQGQLGWGAGDEAALATLFAHFDRFRILCALREAAERGVEGINQILHGWMFAHTGAGLRRETPFYAGEPVLMTANDYRRGIFNGDQGLVLKVDFQGELRQAVAFPAGDGFKVFPLEALRAQVELCYAMTVHKAQGSEYDRIAIVLPRTDHPALTRELLYTALTRARRAVTLIGEAERVDWAAANPTRRDTGLRGRLGGR